jgi:hypothetical protein
VTSRGDLVERLSFAGGHRPLVLVAATLAQSAHALQAEAKRSAVHGRGNRMQAEFL